MIGSPLRLLLRNARLVDPATGLDQPGSLLVEDGRIAALGPAIDATGGAAGEGVRTIDCAGHVLAPGLVDIRVQAREPGDEHLETVASASAAAAAGGITTFCCLPNTEPPIDDVALVDFVSRRGSTIGLVRVHPYAALTKGLKGEALAEIGLMAEAGAVAFTDGVRPVADPRMMRRALAYARNFDALVVQRPEDPSLARGGAMNEGELAARLGLPGIPVEAEVIMLERDIRLAALTGARYHASLVSCAKSVEVVRRAKDAGLAVTCDTTPAYFGLNEVAVSNYRTYAKLSPPLRTEADRLAVLAAVKDGTIDCVVSDHAPFDHDSKRLPFAQASFGGVGLETLLALLLEQVHNGALTLMQALAPVTERPARLMRLPVGRLAQGAPADLVEIDLGRAWKIDNKRFVSKGRNTPFDNKPVQGKVVRALVGGRVVFQG
ncbi:MAG: dihydroorotase [Alphaproteobacteria bacterium]|nr:dihydroorotase [Alphaproteobacteria bacterium]